MTTEGWPDFWIRGKKIDWIDTIDEINTIHTIETINSISNINLIKQAIAQVKSTRIVNGDFETGDLTGWYTQYTSAEYGTIEITDEKKRHGNYSCKITVAEPLGLATPEIDQLVLMETSQVEKIELYWLGDPDTKFWIGVYYVDGTSDDFYDINTDITARWRYFSVAGSALPSGKRIQRIAVGPAKDSVNEGRTFYVDVVNLSPKSLVYQAEKDRTITPLTVENSGSITATENTDGYSLTVNNNYASLVEFAVSLGGAGEIQVQASPNNSDWFTLWTKSLSSAGSYIDWDFVAFPYFRINVPTSGIDVSIWIRAVQI